MPIRPRGCAVIAMLGVAVGLGCGERPVDVYVAGWELQGDRLIATLWVNGAAVRLATTSSLAAAVAVSGSDVLVAGCIDEEPPPASTSYSRAVLWRNGQAQMLSDGTVPDCALAIAVSAADVYVAGHADGVPALWKNGVRQPLVTSGPFASEATGVVVAGGEVQVAGWVMETTVIAPGSFRRAPAAKLWKGGAAPLALPDRLAGGQAFGATADGTDVYVAGSVATPCNAPCSAPDIATVWKNGAATPLTDGRSGAYASGVAVSGGKVYVAGMQENDLGDVPTLWVDGVPTTLGTEAAPGTAEAVAVSGSDVYVAGTRGGAATYWKNDRRVPLSNVGAVGVNLDGSAALGIALAQR